MFDLKVWHQTTVQPLTFSVGLSFINTLSAQRAGLDGWQLHVELSSGHPPKLQYIMR